MKSYVGIVYIFVEGVIIREGDRFYFDFWIYNNLKIEVKFVIFFGDGFFYKNMYSFSIRFYRMKVLIYYLYFSYKGIKGYSCI